MSRPQKTMGLCVCSFLIVYMPVSYTHLDVYKRQVICYPWQQPFVQSYMENHAVIRALPMEQIHEGISDF